MRVEVLYQKGLTTKIHSVCTSERFVLKFQLSVGNSHDAPEGRTLIESIGSKVRIYLIIDKAYEDAEARARALKRGLISVVLRKRIERHRRFTTRPSINYVMKSSVFAVFLLAMIRLDIIYSSVLTLALVFDTLFM